MLSTIISTEAGRRRHLATPLGTYLDGYLLHRCEQGFVFGTMAGDLKWATAFGEYLAKRRSVSIACLSEDEIEAFVAYYRRRSQKCGPARSTPRGSVSLIESLRGSLRSLLVYLRAIGVAAPKPSAEPSTPFDAVLAEYLSFLRKHRGFAELTVEQHRRCGSAFFVQLSRRPVDLAALEAGDIEPVAVALAGPLGRRSRQIMTTSIESLIRYLRATGRVPRSCMPFLPRMKTYALSSLPSVIPWDNVERALSSMDRTGTRGLRNYAMVLLVATYGLRSAEVRGLRLDDVDWRRGALHIRQTKTRRKLVLPLVPAVSDALVAYLRQGRETSDDRRVFMKVHAPRGPVSRAIIYDVVRKALKKAGVQAAHLGPQALRHARATSLLRSGQSLKTIGDLLGHRVPEATMIYCKVAVEDLRSVAIELPQVSS